MIKLFNNLLILVMVTTLLACNDDALDTEAEDHIVAVKRTESWWLARHHSIINQDKSNTDIVFLGDSITHNWEKESHGFALWQAYFGSNALNLGFSGDKTQHLYWRITNGELEGMSPSFVVLNIGTNNSAGDSSEAIARDIISIVGEVKRVLSSSKIIVHAIFPRGESDDTRRAVNGYANELVKQNLPEGNIYFLDINAKFLDAESNILHELMPDKLHPSTEGYFIWATELTEFLSSLE